MVKGPDTPLVRPVEGVYWSCTWAVPPKAEREPRPLTVTADAPAPPPKMTLIWFPAVLT
jgi:hypothetical protein